MIDKIFDKIYYATMAVSDSKGNVISYSTAYLMGAILDTRYTESSFGLSGISLNVYEDYNEYTEQVRMLESLPDACETNMLTELIDTLYDIELSTM